MKTVVYNFVWENRILEHLFRSTVNFAAGMQGISETNDNCSGD